MTERIHLLIPIALATIYQFLEEHNLFISVLHITGPAASEGGSPGVLMDGYKAQFEGQYTIGGKERPFGVGSTPADAITMLFEFFEGEILSINPHLPSIPNRRKLILLPKLDKKLTGTVN